MLSPLWIGSYVLRKGPMSRDRDYYRRLPYRRVVEVQEEAGARYYLARIAEIAGLGGDGATEEEALLRLEEAFDAYLTVCLAEDLEIPEPAEPRSAALGR